VPRRAHALTTHYYSLLTTHYSLLTTHYSLLTHYSLTTHSLLTHYSLDVLLELAAEVEGLQLDVLPQRLEEEHDEPRGGEQAGRRGVKSEGMSVGGRE
jgi:hypothetical protein